MAVVRVYERGLLVGVAMLPMVPILYLQLFQSPESLHHSVLFLEIAIGLAILISGGVTAATAACYQASGEPLQRWLALGLLSFTLIYAPHGILTRFAVDNPALFLLYGPASRVALSALLLVGLMQKNPGPDAPDRRLSPRLVLGWIAGLLVIDSLIAGAALAPGISAAKLRLILESSALLLNLCAIGRLLAQERLSPLLWFFVLGLCYFAFSSVSFFLAAPWNHQWWLAHGIFAAGFLLISYGVVRAFLTTGQLVAVFSTDEWIERVLDANRRAAEALEKLHESNQQLSILASTDTLTGLPNRRSFMADAGHSCERSAAAGQSESLMIIDLDNFKNINDTYGHDVGDEVLIEFAKILRTCMRQASNGGANRPADVIGRVGGEEFAVATPATPLTCARIAAERLRQSCESVTIKLPQGASISISVSIGLAEIPSDADCLSEALRVADKRLYLAKNSGRNQVRIS